MKLNNKPIIYFFSVVAFLGLIFLSFNFKLINAEGRFFLAELAVSSQDMEKGLGERKGLCVRCAMLFDFKNKGNHAFWMKGMRFDLDIIWISEGKVVYIERNFSKDSKKTVRPGVFSDKVLEINSGMAEKYGIDVGDEIIIY